MKRIYQSLTIFFFAIILTGLLSASKTSAKEGSCYLKAISTDVFVIVYDLNRDGDKEVNSHEKVCDERWPCGLGSQSWPWFGDV